MGFFKKFKKAISRVAKPFVRVLPSVIRTPVTKIASGLSSLTPSTLLKYASQGPVLGPLNFAARYAAPKIAPYLQLASDVALAVYSPKLPIGGAKMGFNLGGFLGNVGNALGGIQGGNAGLFRGIGAVTSLVGASIAPRASSPMARTPAVRPGLPAVPGGGMLGAARGVGRSFFQKYPNLGTAIQKYRNAGMSKVTRGRLYSMVRRFGPEMIITGGILTAAAVNELMLAGPGTRRMNPANVKALRRSVRRMESFHKLCGSVDKLRRPRSRGSKGGKGCGTQFVRQG